MDNYVDGWLGLQSAVQTDGQTKSNTGYSQGVRFIKDPGRDFYT